MNRLLSILISGFFGCASMSMADTIELIPTANTSPSHCLGASTSVYVGGFDGKNFEAFTVLSNCDGKTGLPERCLSMAIDNSFAPTELKTPFKGLESRILRHLIPVEEVLGIRFDDRIHSLCPAPELPKWKPRPGPIQQPASFQPLKIADLSLYSPILTSQYSSTTVVDTDWTELVREKQSIKAGDIIKFDASPIIAAHLPKKTASIVMLGKRVATGTTDEVVAIEGKLVGQEPDFTGILVNSVQLSQFTRNLRDAKYFPTREPLIKLNPIRVFQKKSPAGSFNWEAETESDNTLHLRLIKINSYIERTIEVETDSPFSKNTKIRSVRRIN